jgi:hypothetical protein
LFGCSSMTTDGLPFFPLSFVVNRPGYPVPTAIRLVLLPHIGAAAVVAIGGLSGCNRSEIIAGLAGRVFGPASTVKTGSGSAFLRVLFPVSATTLPDRPSPGFLGCIRRQNLPQDSVSACHQSNAECASDRQGRHGERIQLKLLRHSELPPCAFSQACPRPH